MNKFCTKHALIKCKGKQINRKGSKKKKKRKREIYFEDVKMDDIIG